MLKRFFIFGLLIMLLSNCLLPSSTLAQTRANTEAGTKARVRVEKIGTGQAARVERKLRDGSRVRGYISTIESQSFTVVERENGVAHTLAYEDVGEIKRPSNGLSMKSWLIIGAVAAGAVVTWSVVKPAVCDGGAQTRGLC